MARGRFGAWLRLGRACRAVHAGLGRNYDCYELWFKLSLDYSVALLCYIEAANSTNPFEPGCPYKLQYLPRIIPPTRIIPQGRATWENNTSPSNNTPGGMFSWNLRTVYYSAYCMYCEGTAAARKHFSITSWVELRNSHHTAPRKSEMRLQKTQPMRTHEVANSKSLYRLFAACTVYDTMSGGLSLQTKLSPSNNTTHSNNTPG